MIIAWYDTPFIGGRGVGRMMVFQGGTWRVLVRLGIVIKCGTWNCDKMWDLEGVNHAN